MCSISCINTNSTSPYHTEVGGFIGATVASAVTDLENAACIVNREKNPASGGIVGCCFAEDDGGQNDILRCVNSGLVISYSGYDSATTGGIIGWAPLRTVVSECGNSGEVIANRLLNGRSGGILGDFEDRTSDPKGSINNCWNTGKLSGGMVGGIVGYANGTWNGITGNITISNCWSSGTSAYYMYIGGIIARNYQSVVSNCFYLQQNGISRGINGKTDVPEQTKGCTLAEFKNQSSITISAERSGYLNALLNGTDSVWSVNTKEDNELAPGVLKGFSVFSWQL